MAYIPCFEQIKQLAEITVFKDELRVSLSYENFSELIKKFIACVPFDEEWYLEMNPDIKTAIDEGLIETAAEHYVESGYFEGRLPYAPDVNEEWYVQEYPDVAEILDRGEEESPSHHFINRGYREGRLPAPLDD